MTLLFTVILTIAIGALCASSVPLRQRIWQHLLLIKQALLKQAPTATTADDTPDTPLTENNRYIQCLMHQLEITKTLQRVLRKKACEAQGATSTRDNLNRCLELRMALLTAELCAQEGMTSSDTADARPNWVALQKGFGRIIAQQQRRFSGLQTDKDEALSYADAILAMPPNNTTQSDTGQHICALSRQIEQQHEALSKADKRVRQLETKLNLAQKKIGHLQSQNDQLSSHCETDIQPPRLQRSGS